MAEKKGVGHAYNIDFLNVVFAASSLFLFLSVVWMVWDDFDRDWKNTQRRFAQLEYQVTQAQLQQASRARRPEQAAAAPGAAAGGAEEGRGQPAEGRRAAGEARRTLDNRLFRATPDYQTAKATYDQDRYDFEASRNAEGVRAPTQKGQRVAERGAAGRRAEPRAARRSTAEQGRAPEASSASTPVRSRPSQKQIDEMTAEADAAAEAARRHRAERR